MSTVMNAKILIASAGLVLALTAQAGTLDETPEVQFSSAAAQAVQSRSDELATPAAIYEYVRNNYEHVLYHGSRGGSLNTFLGRSGNDVDLASTLIAMLRSQNIPARYAVGIVRVNADVVQNWLGIHNIDLVHAVMRDQGIQGVTLAGDKTYLEFEHVWVEALVAHSHYRGAGPDAAASTTLCASTPSACEWVALDPSFKLRTYHEQGIDVYPHINFDYDAYYEAIKNNDAARLDKNPLEIYEEQILDYLKINHPAKTLEDVADPGVIIPEASGLLPASLPYQVIGESETYDNVSDYDAVAETIWTKNVTVKLSICGMFTAPVMRLVDLATKRLTLTYELGSVQRLVFRLDGEDFYVPLVVGSLYCGPVLVTEGFPFSMILELDGAPDPTGGTADNVISVTYSNLVIGGYYLIGTGGDTSNWSQVHRAAGELLAASEEYPIINDFSDLDFPAGIPYVDENANGVIDGGERRLLDHPEAQDALTGGLLYTAMNLYFTKFHEGIRRLDALNHAISPIEGFVGVVSSVYDVEYLDETAFSVMPGGLLIDMKGQKFSGLWRPAAPNEIANDHFDLVGHVMSSLEHEIWQEITGYDAISTVRGIQFAVGNNDALALDARKDSSGNTLTSFFGGMDFNTSLASPWTKHELSMYSTQPVTWSNTNTNQSFAFFKSDVSTSTSELRQGGAYYHYFTTSNGAFGWLSCVDDVENDLLELKALHGGSATFAEPWTYCEETTISAGTTINQALATTESIYLNEIVPNRLPTFDFGSSTYDYLDVFDKTKGFVPTQYVYRDAVEAADDQPAGLILNIRDDVSLETSGFQRQYLFPSKKPSGNQFLFSVYISRQIQESTGSIAGLFFLISNEGVLANGGYVDATEPLNVTADTSGVVFNNEVFTDQNLNTYINNDLIRTPSTADPVSTVTGNMYHDETDLAIKGRGLDYVFTRTYNSGKAESAGTATPFSQGWTHAYNMRLISNDYGQYPNYDPASAPENDDDVTSSVTYVDERGGELNYLVDSYGGSPSWAVTAPHGNFDTLELDAPTAGEYTLTFRNGTRYIFEDAGANGLDTPGNTARLKRIEDPWGNALDFDYNGNGELSAITDNLGVSGRTGLSLTYDDGKLETVTDWSSRTWTYDYDGDGRLIAVTDPLEQTTEYTYHQDTAYLNQIILPEDRDSDSMGDVVTTFSYYRNGKTFANANAFGDGETIDYDLYRKRTRVTDPRGFIRAYHYDKNGAMTKLEEPDGAILRFKNNADGLRYSKLDGLGFETRYSYQENRSIGDGASDTQGLLSLEKDSLDKTVEYDYGIYDQPTRIEDKNGNEQIRVYYATTDAPSGALEGKLHQIKATVDGTPNVVLTEYTYFPNGNLKRQVEYIDASDANRKRVTDYAYDGDGYNLIETIVNAGSGQMRTTYTYDAFGRTLTETLYRRTSPTNGTLLQLTTTTEYDALGRVIKVTNPRGDIAESVYDANGNVVQEIMHYLQPGPTYDVRIVARHTYDDADRRITTQDIDDEVTHFTYDAGGNMVAVTDALGHVTRYEYDAMNRRTAVIDANGHRSETVYDLAGRVVRQIDANGHAVGFTYDALGRRTQVITPLGHETHFEYDGNGNLVKLKDANGITSAQPYNAFGASVYYEYDELGRKTRVVDAQDDETVYTYDLLGNITSITDAEEQTTEMVYDDFGRLVEVIDPVVESPDLTVTLTYDEAGNVLTRTDRKGQVSQRTYDALNRLTETLYLADSSTESRTYDVHGDLIEVANDAVTYTYTFDNQHRLTGKTDSRGNRTLVWTYDAVGNALTKTDYQADVTHYQYDSTNRLVSEQNSAYLQVSYHYDGAGRLLNRILSNGVQTDYRYDADSRLVELTNRTATGAVIHQQTYSYDAVGNITGVVQDVDFEGGTEAITYTYDPVYRLLNANYPDAAYDESYTYDAVGNRKTLANGAGTLHYLHGAGNRLEEIRQGSDTGTVLYSFEYDSNGNRTAYWAGEMGTGSEVHAYIYDAKDRIGSMSVAGVGAAAFAYDPANYRIGKTTPSETYQYFLEGEHLEAVYDGEDELRAKYLRGVVIDEVVNGYEYDGFGSEVNLNYHHDHLQTVTGVSAHDGQVAERLSFTPFGGLLAHDGIETSRLRYTGREWDADSGLYYYRARYYDPMVGRFLTEDPLGFEAGINFYAYVENNPINNSDPSGYFCVFCLAPAVPAVLKALGIGVTSSVAIGGAFRGTIAATQGGSISGAVFDQNAIMFDVGVGLIGGAAGAGFRASYVSHLPTVLKGNMGEALYRQQLVGSGASFAEQVTVRGAGAKPRIDFVIDSGTSLSAIEVKTFSSPLTSSQQSVFNHISSGGVGQATGVNARGLSQVPVTSFSEVRYGAYDFVRGVDGALGGGLASGLYNSGAAAGGYVLYPNRTNTNMARSVYSK